MSDVQTSLSPEPAPESQQGPGGARKAIGHFIWDIASSTIIAILLSLLIITFVGETARVQGISMQPNIYSNERVVVEKISYREHPPRRGDVVVLQSPIDPNVRLIKRIIGLPGEEIAIHDSTVFINGKPLSEPYLTHATTGYLAPQRIPALRYFIMGDNRNMSMDSRTFGPVARDAIIGRAWLAYWPPKSFGLVSH